MNGKFKSINVLSLIAIFTSACSSGGQSSSAPASTTPPATSQRSSSLLSPPPSIPPTPINLPNTPQGQQPPSANLSTSPALIEPANPTGTNSASSSQTRSDSTLQDSISEFPTPNRDNPDLALDFEGFTFNPPERVERPFPRRPQTSTPVLNPLTEDERAATYGRHSVYSQEFAKSLFPEMHRSGNLWPRKYHEPIFIHGLFNYYFMLYGNYRPDLTAPSDQLTLLEEALHYRSALRNRPERLVEILDTLRFAHTLLRQNPVMRVLGQGFQKQKVRAEHFGGESPNLRLIGLQQSNPYQEEAHVEAQQTLIARWIERVCSRVRTYIIGKLRRGGVMDAANDPFIRNLHQLYPVEMNDLYWASKLRIEETIRFQDTPSEANRYTPEVQARLERIYQAYLVAP